MRSAAPILHAVRERVRERYHVPRGNPYPRLGARTGCRAGTRQRKVRWTSPPCACQASSEVSSGRATPVVATITIFMLDIMMKID